MQKAKRIIVVLMCGWMCSCTAGTAREKAETSPQVEALEAVFATQGEMIRKADKENWRHDVKTREWIVQRPFYPGTIDSTHLFNVSYKIGGKVAAKWFVDTRKKTAQPESLKETDSNKTRRAGDELQMTLTETDEKTDAGQPIYACTFRNRGTESIALDRRVLNRPSLWVKVVAGGKNLPQFGIPPTPRQGWKAEEMVYLRPDDEERFTFSLGEAVYDELKGRKAVMFCYINGQTSPFSPNGRLPNAWDGEAYSNSLVIIPPEEKQQFVLELNVRPIMAAVGEGVSVSATLHNNTWNDLKLDYNTMQTDITLEDAEHRPVPFILLMDIIAVHEKPNPLTLSARKSKEVLGYYAKIEEGTWKIDNISPLFKGAAWVTCSSCWPLKTIPGTYYVQAHFRAPKTENRPAIKLTSEKVKVTIVDKKK